MLIKAALKFKQKYLELPHLNVNLLNKLTRIHKSASQYTLVECSVEATKMIFYLFHKKRSRTPVIFHRKWQRGCLNRATPAVFIRSDILTFTKIIENFCGGLFIMTKHFAGGLRCTHGGLKLCC